MTQLWHNDPDVMVWDRGDRPDLVRLAEMLARHGVTLSEVDTDTDGIAVRITGPDRPSSVHGARSEEKTVHHAEVSSELVLVDSDDDVWRSTGDGRWRSSGGGPMTYAQVVETYGQVREMLLIARHVACITPGDTVTVESNDPDLPEVAWRQLDGDTDAAIAELGYHRVSEWQYTGRQWKAQVTPS